MPDRDEMPTAPVPLLFKTRVKGWLAATLIRLVCLTLRWKINDKAGVLESPPEDSMIWIFWHNRIFAMPVFQRKYLKSRAGAVLTSASRDGGVIAATMKQFGLESVRGSSSRRGVAGLKGLMSWIDGGHDIAITPDGPRGPRYKLAPGPIKLAQATGAKILPIRMDYESAWKLKSWDRFQLPKPFSRVIVNLEPLESIDATADEDSFEAERLRVQTILNPENETD